MLTINSLLRLILSFSVLIHLTNQGRVYSILINLFVTFLAEAVFYWGNILAWDINSVDLRTIWRSLSLDYVLLIMCLAFLDMLYFLLKFLLDISKWWFSFTFTLHYRRWNSIARVLIDEMDSGHLWSSWGAYVDGITERYITISNP